MAKKPVEFTEEEKKILRIKYFHYCLKFKKSPLKVGSQISKGLDFMSTINNAYERESFIEELEIEMPTFKESNLSMEELPEYIFPVEALAVVEEIRELSALYPLLDSNYERLMLAATVQQNTLIKNLSSKIEELSEVIASLKPTAFST